MAAKPSSVILLRELAAAVEQLGETQVRRILRDATGGAEQGALPLRLSTNKKQFGTARTPRPNRSELIAELLNQLQTVDARAEGLRKLRDADLSRRELEGLARLIDVPIRKDQRVGDLEELIVNVTIGGRLNSKAIRYGS